MGIETLAATSDKFTLKFFTIFPSESMRTCAGSPPVSHVGNHLLFTWGGWLLDASAAAAQALCGMYLTNSMSQQKTENINKLPMETLLYQAVSERLIRGSRAFQLQLVTSSHSPHEVGPCRAKHFLAPFPEANSAPFPAIASQITKVEQQWLKCCCLQTGIHVLSNPRWFQ